MWQFATGSRVNPYINSSKINENKSMNTIERKEYEAAYEMRTLAFSKAQKYTIDHNDLTATTLALLWCAFETEAMAQGLTQWRGIKLGDI